MDTHRIVINNTDLSTSTIETATAYYGFTIVDAEKGPTTPYRVPANSSALIQDIFGLPSKDYPEIYEAQSFNSDYDVYVSAPYTEASVPVAYVTKDGIFENNTPVTYDENVEKLIFEDASTAISGITSVAENTTIRVTACYPNSNLGLGTDISSNGKSIEYIAKSTSASNYDTDVLKVYLGLDSSTTDSIVLDVDKAEAAGFGVGSAQKIKNFSIFSRKEDYLETTEKHNILLTVSTTNPTAQNGEDNDTNKVAVTIKYGSTACDYSTTDKCLIIPVIGTTSTWYGNNENLSSVECAWLKSITNADVVGTILPKYPSQRTLHLSFSSFDENRGYSSMSVYGRNIIKMNVYEEGAFHDKAHTLSITGSLDYTSRDANSGYLMFGSKNTAYTEQELVYVYSFGKGFEKIGDDFRKLTGYKDLVLSGGTRSVEGNNESTVWDVAKKSEYASVNVFFNSKIHEAQPETTGFFALAGTHELAGYIFNFTTESSSSVTSALSYGERYWHIGNEAVIELKDGSRIFSPMTGARAKMQCRIIENAYGGIAPMFLNSGTPSMGGQLDVSPIRMKYRYTKDEQKAFDDLNMNLAILDHTYGVYVINQRTCKAGEATDWSYIGHVSSFLEFEREVRENVMVPQIGKANNDYYRTLRKQQVESIISKRISGTNRIWAAATCDTSTADGCNDLAARRARKFIINVKVKVNTFSEVVELNFTNVDQSVEL